MSELMARVDEYGRTGWIAVTVLGFIVFWPVGVALLGYLLWSGRMSFGWNGERGRTPSRFANTFNQARDRASAEFRGFGNRASGNRTTGNHAFDDYRSQTLQRLEDEAREFREFLSKLRGAKDKTEFEEFMRQRRSPNAATSSG